MQDFGNFQDMEGKEREKTERLRFGRFFYRFPNGESGAGAHNPGPPVMQTAAHAQSIAAERSWRASADKVRLILMDADQRRPRTFLQTCTTA